MVKRTIWARALTGASNAAKPSTWKRSAKKAIPHASKQGKDSSGFNLSYYRKTFFMLEKQVQFDLYMNGLAPKMTRLEVNMLKASRRPAVRVFRAHAVMYDTHISPSGYAAPPRDIVAEAKKAKIRAVEAAEARKKKLANSTSAAPGDALPIHPTPAHYAKIQVQQQRPAKARPQQQQQQQHQQQQRQQQLEHRLQQQQQQREQQLEHRLQQQKLLRQQRHQRQEEQQQQQQQQQQQLQHERRQKQPQYRLERLEQQQQQQPARVKQSVVVPVTAQGRAAGRRVAGQSLASSSRN